jgi:acetyl/propionyl-CoA carboxylase alpha subunit
VLVAAEVPAEFQATRHRVEIVLDEMLDGFHCLHCCDFRHTPVAGQSGEAGTEDGALPAPMPGHIVLMDTPQRSGVSKDQKLIVMEAMKMPNDS